MSIDPWYVEIRHRRLKVFFWLLIGVLLLIAGYSNDSVLSMGLSASAFVWAFYLSQDL